MPSSEQYVTRITDIFVVRQYQQNFVPALSASTDIMVPVNRALFPDPPLLFSGALLMPPSLQ